MIRPRADTRSRARIHPGAAAKEIRLPGRASCCSRSARSASAIAYPLRGMENCEWRIEKRDHCSTQAYIALRTLSSFSILNSPFRLFSRPYRGRVALGHADQVRPSYRVAVLAMPVRGRLAVAIDLRRRGLHALDLVIFLVGVDVIEVVRL